MKGRWERVGEWESERVKNPKASGNPWPRLLAHSHAPTLPRSHALTRFALRLLALAALAVAGCTHPFEELEEAVMRREPPPPPRVIVYRSRLLPNAARLRVLVLPFRHLDPSASRAVTNAFVLELQKSQMFEVVSPYGQAAPVLDEVRMWQESGLDVRGLIAVRRRLGVDALVLGHVLDYRPFDPQILSLRIQVVSTRTGAVLGGAEACFDAREAGVQAAMKSFHEHWLEGSDRPSDWRLLLASPWHYAQFVSHCLVKALGQSEVAASAPPPEGFSRIAPSGG